MPRPSDAAPEPSRLVLDQPGNIISPDFSASARTPVLDTGAFVAGAEGGAAIGKGLMQAGSAAEALAAKVQEADQIHAEHKASLAMMAANQDIQSAVANEPDQSKWQDIAAARMDMLQQELGGIKVPNPQTQESIDYKYKANRIDVFGGLQTQSNRKSIGDAKQSLIDNVQYGAMTANPDLVDHTLSGGLKKGFFTPEEVRLMSEKAGKTIEQVQQNQQITAGEAIIQADPKAALDHFNSEDFTKNTNPVVVQRLQGQARAAVHRQQEAVSDQVLGDVQSGTITVPAQIDELEKDPSIPKHVIASARNMLSKITNADKRQWESDNSSKIMSGGMAMLQDYDPTKDKDRTQYNAINEWILGNAPPGAKEELRKQLTAKMGKDGKPGVAKEKDPALQQVATALQSMHKGQELGVKYITPGESTLNADGKTFHRKDDAIDRQKEAQSRDTMIGAMTDVRDYYASHPKATQQELMTVAQMSVPAHIRARALDSLGVFGGSAGPSTSDAVSGVPGRRDFMDLVNGLPRYQPRAPKAQPVSEEDAKPKGILEQPPGGEEKTPSSGKKPDGSSRNKEAALPSEEDSAPGEPGDKGPSSLLLPQGPGGETADAPPNLEEGPKDASGTPIKHREITSSDIKEAGKESMMVYDTKQKQWLYVIPSEVKSGGKRYLIEDK